jgi:hypothetical protein
MLTITSTAATMRKGFTTLERKLKGQQTYKSFTLEEYLEQGRYGSYYQAHADRRTAQDWEASMNPVRDSVLAWEIDSPPSTPTPGSGVNSSSASTTGTKRSITSILGSQLERVSSLTNKALNTMGTFSKAALGAIDTTGRGRKIVKVISFRGRSTVIGTGRAVVKPYKRVKVSLKRRDMRHFKRDLKKRDEYVLEAKQEMTMEEWREIAKSQKRWDIFH